MTDPTSEVRIENPCPVCGTGLVSRSAGAVGDDPSEMVGGPALPPPSVSHRPAGGRPVTACPRCHTPHHTECWVYNGGCSIFGCPAGPVHMDHPGVGRFVPSAAARRLSIVVAILVGLVALVAAIVSARPVKVRFSALRSDPGSTLVVFHTDRRVACDVQVAPLAQADRAVFRQATPRGRCHRVQVPGLDPGSSYLLSVRRRGSEDVVATTRLVMPLRRRESPVRCDAGPMRDALTRSFASCRFLDSLRDPFSFPWQQGGDRLPPTSLATASESVKSVRMKIIPGGEKRPYLGGFNVTIERSGCTIRWQTDLPMWLSRVVVSRDRTLRGVERVVDASTMESGRSHSVTLTDLRPDTNYQVLILGFPAKGEPVQSPVLALRTMPR
ncbi:MAG: hypothetical protein HY815_11575 [Candidatus Riflebacteria bacterium]|nr:hypothetical protein [Candidatus Riflebacteria bacterium]